MRRPLQTVGLLLLLVLGSESAPATGNGKLLATGGLTSIDGAAGGGLVPWAVIAGHADVGEWDASVGLSYVDTGDFDLQSAAVTLGWSDRLELSAARLSLGLDALMRTGAIDNVRLDADVLGAKLKLSGDLIYGNWPQISAGVQYRRSRDRALVEMAGAKDDRGVDVYVAASRQPPAACGSMESPDGAHWRI